ncbi:hypothetical protein X942_5814 [Burkholderia pseudomallei MSHR5596]|nr:hypothetical protein X942_5814 [Burkholderia pseudomallei MSHR5596]
MKAWLAEDVLGHEPISNKPNQQRSMRMRRLPVLEDRSWKSRQRRTCGSWAK